MTPNNNPAGVLNIVPSDLQDPSLQRLNKRFQIDENRISTLESTVSTLQSDVSGLQSAPDAIDFLIDGGATAPSTGSKGYKQVPWDCTITGWTLLADASGSAQITVKMSDYADFPATASIVASAPPALVSQQNNASSGLPGWVTGLTKGDILEFNLDFVTTCKRLTLTLAVTKT